MGAQRKVVITHDRDKTSVECKTTGNCCMTQNTLKKNVRNRASITTQLNEEASKKSKTCTARNCLHRWNSTDAMKLLAPPNEIVADSC